MKKYLPIFILVLMLLLVFCCFAACTPANPGTSDAGNNNTETPSEKTVTIKYSLSHSSTEPAVVAAYSFAERVAAKSNNTIIIEVYPENQLGNERDVVEGIQLHTVGMADPANGVLTNFIKEANVFEMPMLFNDKAHAKAVCENLGFEFYDKPCSDAGFKLLGFLNMGTRHILTVKKPINGIEDLKGLKIRTQESPANVASFNAFGANATPMAYGEVYTALESGVLDGAEAANVNYLSKAFYEVAPNWAMVGWLELINPIIMDKQVWDSLSENQQNIINEEVKIMIDEEWSGYAAAEETSLETLKANGIQITTPDKEPFRAASKTVWEKFADTFGGIENIDRIINFQY